MLTIGNHQCKTSFTTWCKFGYHLITIIKVIAFKLICKSGNPITFLSVTYIANQATTWIQCYLMATAATEQLHFCKRIQANVMYTTNPTFYLISFLTTTLANATCSSYQSTCTAANATGLSDYNTLHPLEIQLHSYMLITYFMPMLLG